MDPTHVHDILRALERIAKSSEELLEILAALNSNLVAVSNAIGENG